MDREDARAVQREAAAILGVYISTVRKMVARGQLTSHGHRAGGSLDRTEVEAFAKVRRRRAAADERKRQAARRDRTPKPPDIEHEWLSTSQAAALLGVTPQAIVNRSNRDRLPHPWQDGRRWVRPDLLELVERARGARAELK